MSTKPKEKKKESSFIDESIDTKLSDSEQQRRLIKAARDRRERMKALQVHNDLIAAWALSYEPEDKK